LTSLQFCGKIFSLLKKANIERMCEMNMQKFHKLLLKKENLEDYLIEK